MSGLMWILFTSFQISSLLGSPTSNGKFASENYSRASKILHAEVYPERLPQKCCNSANQIYVYLEGHCSNLTTNETEIFTSEISPLLPFLNLTRTIKCALTFILDELEEGNYTLLENGMLYEDKRNKTHDHDHFCFEYIREVERFMPVICINQSELVHSNQSNSSTVQKPTPETPQSKPKIDATEPSNYFPAAEKSDIETPKSKPKIDETEQSNLSSTVQKSDRETPKSKPEIDKTEQSDNSNTVQKSNCGTTKSKHHRKRYLYTLGLSTSFLIVTLCIYSIIPELHLNEFDWSLMCHIASLIIGFCCLTAYSNVSSNNVLCVPLALMRQFWILSSFCWLNVMGIYLWRSMIPNKVSGTFPVVCLYAVGFPASVSIVTFLATMLTTSHQSIVPGFEKTRWSQEQDENFWFNPKFKYFYISALMTIIINLSLFIIMVFKILIQNSGDKPTVYQDGQRYNFLWMRFFLCLKLFFIMGLSWIAEVASFWVKEEELRWRLKNEAVLWHGIFIFISFVVNKRVITLLLNRFSIGQRFKSLHAEKKVLFIPDKANARVIVR